MTLPERCEPPAKALHDCFARVNFLSRIVGGACDEYHKQFEACLRKEYIKKKRQSFRDGKERKKKWVERNEELGLPNPFGDGGSKVTGSGSGASSANSSSTAQQQTTEKKQ